MEWLLGVSVVLNIVLSLALAVLIYLLVGYMNDASFNRSEWERWEDRFYTVQGKLVDDHNLFVSVNGGEYGEMVIKEYKGSYNKQ